MPLSFDFTSVPYYTVVTTSVVAYLLLFEIHISCAQQAQQQEEDIPFHERRALEQIFTACNGKNWAPASAYSGWMHPGPVCSGLWQGVVCNPVADDGNRTHVTGLTIRRNGAMDCEIPTSLASLVYMRTLDLSRSTLKGPFPTVVRGWHAVTQLRLSGTGIAGTLPEWLSEHRHLTVLDVSDTELSGSIPDSLSQLPWTEVQLSNTRFSGTLPQFLLSVPTWSLSGSGLRFTGPCPPPLWYRGSIDCSGGRSSSSSSSRSGNGKSLPRPNDALVPDDNRVRVSWFQANHSAVLGGLGATVAFLGLILYIRRSNLVDSVGGGYHNTYPPTSSSASYLSRWRGATNNNINSNSSAAVVSLEERGYAPLAERDMLGCGEPTRTSSRRHRHGKSKEGRRGKGDDQVAAATATGATTTTRASNDTYGSTSTSGGLGYDYYSEEMAALRNLGK